MIQLFAHLYTTTSVCVFARFHYPKLFAELWHAVQDGFFIWILSVVEQLLELQVRWVVEALFDVEG